MTSADADNCLGGDCKAFCASSMLQSKASKAATAENNSAEDVRPPAISSSVAKAPGRPHDAGPCGLGIFGGLGGKANSLAYDRFLTRCEKPSFGYGVSLCKQIATKAFEGRNLSAPFPVHEDEISDFCQEVRALLIAHEDHEKLRLTTQPFRGTSLLTARSQSNSSSERDLLTSSTSSNSDVDDTVDGKDGNIVGKIAGMFR